MPRPEIFDRSAVEILVDHRWTHVRATRNGRRIPKLLSDASHDGRDHALCLCLGLPWAALRKCNGRDQRPAPRAEVLRRELVAEVRANIVVEPRACQGAEAPFPLVTKEAASAGQSEQLLHRGRELLVD